MSLTATDENVKSRFIINYDYEENQFRIYVDICIVCVCVIFPIFGTIQFQGLSFAALLCWTAKLGKKIWCQDLIQQSTFQPSYTSFEEPRLSFINILFRGLN